MICLRSLGSFGVCCVFIVNTATTVSQNCSYLQNPAFPSSDSASTSALTYTIARCSNGTTVMSALWMSEPDMLDVRTLIYCSELQFY